MTPPSNRNAELVGLKEEQLIAETTEKQNTDRAATLTSSHTPTVSQHPSSVHSNTVIHQKVELENPPGPLNFTFNIVNNLRSPNIPRPKLSGDAVMGPKLSKHTNNLHIENTQKALIAHEQTKKQKMMYMPGEEKYFFGECNGSPGWSTASFHKETFFTVIATCLALTALSYLLYTCIKNGSCLPSFVRGHFKEKAAVRYNMNGPTAPECIIAMPQNLQPPLTARPFSIPVPQIPVPHLTQPVDPRQYQFVHPKLNEMTSTATMMDENKMKGAAFAPSYNKG